MKNSGKIKQQQSTLQKPARGFTESVVSGSLLGYISLFKE